jgi:exo-beta-1,3-glucanase (GH17 family)
MLFAATGCVRARRAGALAAVCAFLALAPPARAEPVCRVGLPAAPALLRLRESLAQGRFVAYVPTSLRMKDGRATDANPESIRDDLAILRPRFDGLITYGALHGAEAIPGIAAAHKFRALVIGVWDPFDEREVHAAIAAATRYPALVAGISLGNEVVFARRRDLGVLTRRIAELHGRAPDVPLSTTEPFHVYYEENARMLLRELDFLLVNVHPVFQPWFRAAPDENAAQFVVGVHSRLAEGYCGPILIKETGVPTAPSASGYTQKRQASFYGALRGAFAPSPQRAFAYFSAFDAPWRVDDEQAVAGNHPEEAHWGLYDEGRRAKDAALEIPLLPMNDRP